MPPNRRPKNQENQPLSLWLTSIFALIVFNIRGYSDTVMPGRSHLFGGKMPPRMRAERPNRGGKMTAWDGENYR